MERNQFTFYKSFYFGLKNLKKRDRLAVYDAIVFYGLFGYQQEELTQKQQDFFNMMKPNLDASAKKAVQAGEADKKAECKKENKEKVKIKNEIKGKSLYSAPAREQTDLFLSFWEAYPNQLDREEACLAWCELVPGESLAQEICQGLQAWKKSKQWQEDGGRYVPTAGNFLKRGYWKTKPPKGSPGGDGKPSGTLGAAELENIQRLMQEMA